MDEHTCSILWPETVSKTQKVDNKFQPYLQEM